MARFGENGHCEVAEKSSRIAYKKPGVGDTLSPPFCPHLTDRAQNFVNVVDPWPVHVYRLWSGSAAVCRTYYGKSPKKWIQHRLSAYKYATAGWIYLASMPGRASIVKISWGQCLSTQYSPSVYRFCNIVWWHASLWTWEQDWHMMGWCTVQFGVSVNVQIQNGWFCWCQLIYVVLERGGWGDRHSWAVKRICFVYTGHNNSFAYCLLTDLLNCFQMLTNLENGLAEDGSMIQLNDTSFRGRPI